jgi:hypothetical protein
MKSRIVESFKVRNLYRSGNTARVIKCKVLSRLAIYSESIIAEIYPSKPIGKKPQRTLRRR